MKTRALPRRWLARLAVTLASAVLPGCTAADIVNALVPRDGFELHSDIRYGSESRQTLDLYRPMRSAGTRPVVVFFYGGNWDSGDKKDYLFVGQALASRGFLVVVPNYRLYPEVRYPAFVKDSAAAVAWTLENIGAWGGDPADVNLLGHSAGAYNAMMLAVDPRWLGDAARRRIRSVTGLAGPYDFLPLTDPVVEAIFATEADLSRTQPITYADASAPPALLLSGRNDHTVNPANSARLAARLRARSGRVHEQYYNATGHVALIAAMAWPLRFLAPVLDDTVAFIEALPRSSGS